MVMGYWGERGKLGCRNLILESFVADFLSEGREDETGRAVFSVSIFPEFARPSGFYVWLTRLRRGWQGGSTAARLRARPQKKERTDVEGRTRWQWTSEERNSERGEGAGGISEKAWSDNGGIRVRPIWNTWQLLLKQWVPILLLLLHFCLALPVKLSQPGTGSPLFWWPCTVHWPKWPLRRSSMIQPDTCKFWVIPIITQELKFYYRDCPDVFMVIKLLLWAHFRNRTYYGFNHCTVLQTVRWLWV